MGFRIWAYGLRGFKRSSGKARKPFRYLRKDCLDQKDFEPPKILSMIPSSPNAAGVAKKIVGTPSSHLGSAKVKGMSKIAQMIFVHHIVSGINLLATHGSGGRVSLYCHQKNRLWVDTNSFVNCHFFGNNPGRDFLKKIMPGLKRTDLNCFGVLAQIAIVLSEYKSSSRGVRLPKSAESFLRIEIRH